MSARRVGVIVSAITVASALMLASGGAYGADATTHADDPTRADLTPEQQQAIAAWEAPQAVAESGAAIAEEGGGLKAIRSASTAITTMAATTTWTARSSLYRGSWLMWANEHVDFGSNSTRVTWSSGYQDSGAIFPNNVSELGTKRITNNGWNHVWRGGYRVGAGVPTPWGNANVYSQTSYAQTTVMRNNAWIGEWNN